MVEKKKPYIQPKSEKIGFEYNKVVACSGGGKDAYSCSQSTKSPWSCSSGNSRKSPWMCW